MDKYVIYTMGNEKMNEAVLVVLLGKGYGEKGWAADAYLFFIDQNNFDFLFADDPQWIKIPGIKSRNYKEITFKQLCELPPVHDEVEDIAKELVAYIKRQTWWEDFAPERFCDVWERMKPKLGLT